MDGFFSEASFTNRQPISLLPDCGSCGLFKLCRSPKMPVSGKGKKGILIIGEAPGQSEDHKGIHFAGETGHILSKNLAKVGINMRDDCWLTNAIICRPPKNAVPTKKQLTSCRPNLIQTIRDLEPDIIIPLGSAAITSLFSQIWKENVGPITRWVNREIPCQKPNAWIFPNYNPSFILRSQKKSPIAETLFRRYLKRATWLKGKPWKKIPDLESQVQVIMDPSKAAKAIRIMMAFGKPMAFDYETDRLKPDHSDAEIICAAVSDGVTAIGYPMIGEAIAATRMFLESRIRKYGHNIKFEDRWSRRLLVDRVRNWKWDSMLAAHVLDHRSQITSLKFQSFVNFGFESYDDDIKPYLKGKNSNLPNRVREIPMRKLLLYNGYDAILTHMLSTLQMKLLGA